MVGHVRNIHTIEALPNANEIYLPFCSESVTLAATIVKVRICGYPVILLVILLGNKEQFLCGVSHFAGTIR